MDAQTVDYRRGALYLLVAAALALAIAYATGAPSGVLLTIGILGLAGVIALVVLANRRAP